MSYYTNKNFFKNQIRKPENLWYIMSEDDRLTEFYAVRNSQKETLLTGARRLEKGAIVHPAGDPAAKLLITSDDDHGLNFSHEFLEMNHDAIVRRFDAGDGPKDAFGRPQILEPATLFATIPLALTGSSSKDATSPDRSGTATTYSFSTSSRYGLKPKDRLVINGEQLTISGILLSSTPGLTEFRAISGP